MHRHARPSDSKGSLETDACRPLLSLACLLQSSRTIKEKLKAKMNAIKEKLKMKASKGKPDFKTTEMADARDEVKA